MLDTWKYGEYLMVVVSDPAAIKRFRNNKLYKQVGIYYQKRKVIKLQFLVKNKKEIEKLLKEVK
jgi:hypothetical protein